MFRSHKTPCCHQQRNRGEEWFDDLDHNIGSFKQKYSWIKNAEAETYAQSALNDQNQQKLALNVGEKDQAAKKQQIIKTEKNA